MIYWRSRKRRGEGKLVARADEINLEGFSIPELENLAVRVVVQINNKKEERKRELLEEMEKIAEREGLTLKEVMRAGRKAQKRRPPKPKYRNPEDSSKTWSGRGKKPAWVVAALDSGKSLEDLQI
jgi:DNA-binding protein H-NS